MGNDGLDKRRGDKRGYALCGLVLAGLLVGNMLGGCGSAGPRMVTVSGQVTLNGKPLEEGTIVFQDPQGNAPTAQAVIRQGSYSCQVLPGRKKKSDHPGFQGGGPRAGKPGRSR